MRYNRVQFMNVMMTEMNLHSLVETKKRESPFKYGDSGMVGSQEITAQEFFVMKKILSLVAFLCCITLMLAGCGNTNNTPTAPTEESNDKGNRVVIYTAAEDERIAYLQEELDKHFPSDEIVIQSIVPASFWPNCRPRARTAIAISSMIWRLSTQRSY